MKKLEIFVILILVSIAYTVSAHDIAESGTATLLVHIEPGEMAVAGKAVTLYINLENFEKGFSLEKCNCVFTIKQDEKEIFSAPLVPTKTNGEFDAKGIPFTFPNDGEYHLSVRATPITTNLFAPFEVEVHEKALPVGTVTPLNTTIINNTYHTHNHAYPRVELAGMLIFTIVMTYFLFSDNKSLAKQIVRKRQFN
ncbi:MAG: hypothetical protein WAX85_00900 [Minisyncoccia bacterium]